MNVLCFVFSWKGQYENAVRLEKELSDLGLKVVVVNSDDENTPEKWINIGNDCYFSDQFRKALEVFNSSDYDFLWHVQADASFDDWKSILNSAESSYEKYKWGVFAPNVDDTFYVSSRTDAFDLEEGLKVVATTDNTCWIINKEIIEDLNSNIELMEDNVLGWGWDLLLCAFSHIKKKYVIRDYKYTVNHPPSTGYKKEQAENEMLKMFENCPEELKLAIYRIKVKPQEIALYHNVADSNQTKNSILIYDTEARL